MNLDGSLLSCFLLFFILCKCSCHTSCFLSSCLVSSHVLLYYVISFHCISLHLIASSSFHPVTSDLNSFHLTSSPLSFFISSYLMSQNLIVLHLISHLFSLPESLPTSPSYHLISITTSCFISSHVILPNVLAAVLLLVHSRSLLLISSHLIEPRLISTQITSPNLTSHHISSYSISSISSHLSSSSIKSTQFSLPHLKKALHLTVLPHLMSPCLLSSYMMT